MTKRWKICSLLAAAVLGLLLMVFAWMFGMSEPVSADTTDRGEMNPAVYSVRLEGDLLGAYSAESGELLFSSPVDAAQMSGNDRALLQTGLSAGTLEEVLGIFEDFCS